METSCAGESYPSGSPPAGHMGLSKSVWREASMPQRTPRADGHWAVCGHFREGPSRTPSQLCKLGGSQVVQSLFGPLREVNAVPYGDRTAPPPSHRSGWEDESKHLTSDSLARYGQPASTMPLSAVPKWCGRGESVKIPKVETYLFVAAGRARNLEAGRRHACQMIRAGSGPDHHRRPAACDWAVSRPWMRANLTGRSISGGGTAETCRVSVSGRANGKWEWTRGGLQECRTPPAGEEANPTNSAVTASCLYHPVTAG
ncbi:hypothetical protein B0T18DRAFT_472405 [Schizothecium vesticola]|uniref:Uncharacterized protein n=1 Tax=Schizothecium vesticola TaxID=314040 RepID=A0AA40EKK6_9PEZI|nr:hypothetical protein B0T18DRAFT_472405 [Schizothecium vesticola]